MGITKLLPVFKSALRNRDALMEDGLDPRAHASRHAQTGVNMGRKAATAPLKAWENVPRMVVRGLQFFLAIVVCGVYGNRIDANRKAGTTQSPEWLFGVAVAGLSCITAVLFAIMAPFGAVSNKFKTARMFAWDLTLFVLWIAVFGIFAGIFLKRGDDDEYKGSSTTLMKGTVWVDLVNAIFWLVSGTYGFAKTFLGKQADGLGAKVTGKLFDRKKRVPEEKVEMYYGV